MTSTPQTAAPSPAAANNEVAFLTALRRLKTWSGMSFRQLERRARAAGDSLPASTAATMLGRNRLPREELLVVFLRACGLDADGMLPWLTTRAVLADRPNTGAPAAIPPGARPTPRWRLAVVAVAAAAVALAGGAAFAVGSESNSADEQETVVGTP